MALDPTVSLYATTRWLSFATFPTAAICPIYRACSARRRPTVKPVPDSRYASLTSSWSVAVAPCSTSLWRKGNGIVIVRSSSMAQAARCPIRRPSSAHLDAAVYPVAELAELYRQRWQVETSLAQLNTTMQTEVLHGQTVADVLKELTVFALVYNLVRMAMCQSATLQHLSVERISVVDALQWLGAPSTGIPLARHSLDGVKSSFIVQ
jgi:hypothetical protein